MRVVSLCRRFPGSFVILLSAMAFGSSPAVAQERDGATGRPGVVEGRVVEAGTGEPLPGAKVIVTGATTETSTDRDGFFRLASVPPGRRSVVVTYLGRKDEIVEVSLAAAATQRLDVRMSLAGYEETVTVDRAT